MEKKKRANKVVCCLPSCKEIGRRKCTFASVSDIYTACGVPLSVIVMTVVVLYLRILLFLFVNSITNVFTNT